MHCWQRERAGEEVAFRSINSQISPIFLHQLSNGAHFLVPKGSADSHRRDIGLNCYLSPDRQASTVCNSCISPPIALLIDDLSRYQPRLTITYLPRNPAFKLLKVQVNRMSNVVARIADGSVLQQHCVRRDPGYLRHRVRDEHDGGFLDKLCYGIEAFHPKGEIPDSQNLVKEQDVWLNEFRRYRETQSHLHPRTIALHRRIDEISNLSKLDNLVEFAGDLLFGHSKDGAIYINILAAC